MPTYSMGDPFGDNTGLEKAATVRKEKAHEVGKVVSALQNLEKTAERMSRSELFALQQEIGLAVAAFNRALLYSIERSK